jgi:hypothetical protein
MVKSLKVNALNSPISETKPRFSLGGWNIKDWFKGNWTTIVEVGKAGLSLGLGYLAGINLFATNPALFSFATMVISLAAKMACDALHYFLVEKE